MSFVRIWVHVVFTTKNREAYFDSNIRKQLIDHILENCLKKAIHVDSIGGWSEHLHILIALGRDQDIAKVMMLIKGESSHWLNAQGFFRGKFFWQDDYFAVSVSESKVDDVRKYIAKQETHHQAVPFDRELASLQRVVRGDLSG